MRIAFVGRGGSGRTTSAAVFARYVAALGRPVVAIDAATDQRLGAALGHDGPAPLALGATPTFALGPRMLDLDPAGELLTRYAATTPDGVRYLVTGAFDVGALEPVLDHLLDGPGEYVVVDVTAGADAFAGLFRRFDLTVLVSEPTKRGVGVYRQYAGSADGHGVELRVLGNKIDGCADAVWLRQQVGDALIGCVGQSAWVRAAERGSPAGVGDLEPSNLAAFDSVLTDLDAQRRDRSACHRGRDAAAPIL